MYATDHCYTAICTYTQLATMYSLELISYVLLEFYNHFVTNDLHNFHTLRQISHEMYYCGMKIHTWYELIPYLY